jgi:hypothetical protein
VAGRERNEIQLSLVRSYLKLKIRPLVCLLLFYFVCGSRAAALFCKHTPGRNQPLRHGSSFSFLPIRLIFGSSVTRPFCTLSYYFVFFPLLFWLLRPRPARICHIINKQTVKDIFGRSNDSHYLHTRHNKVRCLYTRKLVYILPLCFMVISHFLVRSLKWLFETQRNEQRLLFFPAAWNGGLLYADLVRNDKRLRGFNICVSQPYKIIAMQGK